MSVRLVAAADGNLTSAAVFALVDDTSLLNSEVANSAVPTTGVASTTFTGLSGTYDALLHKVASRAVSPVGTFSAVLYCETDAAAVAMVTCNVSDIPANATQGWLKFKFGAPVTLNGAKVYSVRPSTSNANQVFLFRDGTANNFSRMLRSTTLQAPAAGDKLLVIGSITGANTTTTRSVTMDSDGTLTCGCLVVGFNGTVTWDTTAGVTRDLKLSGFARTDGTVDGIVVFTGGTINIGSVGTPYPSTSTAIIEYLVGTNVAFGREMRGGTMSRYGSPKTLQAFLSQDYSAGATSIVITPVGGGTQTGIKSGDVIALAPGSTNAAGVSACESFTLGVDPVGNTITLPSGLVNDRLNVSIYPVEVLILSCNVQEQGASNTLQSYVNIQANSTETDRYVRTKWMGSATEPKRGFQLSGTATVDVQNCVSREFGVNISTNAQTVASCHMFEVASAASFTYSNNVCYGVSQSWLSSTAIAAVSMTTGNWCGLETQAQVGFGGSDAGSTCTNNRVFGAAGVGIQIAETNAVLGTCTGNVAHHCSSVGARLTNLAGGSTSGWLCYKNTTADISIQGNRDLLTIDSSTFAWSPGTNVIFDAANYAPVLFTSCNLKRGLSGTLTPIAVSNSTSAYATFRNCAVEAATQTSFTAAAFGQILFDNCTAPNATTDVANQATNMLTGSYVAFTRYNGVAGSEKFYRPEGTRASDTVIFDGGTRSTRLTPNSASVKLPTSAISVPVASGQTPTVSVRVRKSISTDAGGANYNGAQPRLMLRTRYAMGVTSDTVLATYSAGLGAWNTLSATLPAAPRDGVYELFVDLDGTAGWVNLDTLSVTGAAADAGGTAKYWTASADPLPLNNLSLVSSTETSSGSDSSTLLASISSQESAAGTDTSAVVAGLQGTETVTSTESPSTAVVLSSQESAVGVDAGSYPSGFISLQETAGGVDQLQFFQESVPRFRGTKVGS